MLTVHARTPPPARAACTPLGCPLSPLPRTSSHSASQRFPSPHGALLLGGSMRGKADRGRAPGCKRLLGGGGNARRRARRLLTADCPLSPHPTLFLDTSELVRVQGVCRLAAMLACRLHAFVPARCSSCPPETNPRPLDRLPPGPCRPCSPGAYVVQGMTVIACRWVQACSPAAESLQLVTLEGHWPLRLHLPAVARALTVSLPPCSYASLPARRARLAAPWRIRCITLQRPTPTSTGARS